MGMTYVQKLLAKVCGRPHVAVGDVLEPEVQLAMSHENGALVITTGIVQGRELRFVLRIEKTKQAENTYKKLR